jgi:hypothetical protein
MLKGIYVLIFFVCTSIITWGYAIKFNFYNNIPFSGDPAFYIWSFKWLPHAIRNDLNIFITDLFWYPYGQNLAWTTFIPSLSITFWYITEKFSPMLSYNLATVLNFALGSFGFYLLSRAIGFSAVASFLASILFFFSPYSWVQSLSHINLSITFTVPFLLLLSVLRFKESIGRLQYIFISTLLLVYQFGISNEIYATMVMFGFISASLFAIVNRKSKEHITKIKNLMLDSAISLFLSALFLSPYIYFMFKDKVDKHIGNIYAQITDPINFIIPTKATFLLGEHLYPISSRFTSPLEEASAYIGIPLLLILISAFLSLRNVIGVRYLFTLLIIVLVLSFGSYLTIMGKQIVPMPWMIFSNI